MDAAAVDNPVSHIQQINDCDVVKYNGEYYISGNWLKGDMLCSRDLGNWGERTHVFSWDNTWHTQVNQDDPDYDIHGTHMRYLNGTFYLYAHLDVSSGIVHAKSANLWGPYIEPVNAAFTGNGWLIDADTFVDEDGQIYYYETNRQGGSGHEIRARTMSDLSTLSGSWDLQIQDSQSWEGNVINEGSKVFKYRGRYYMLYNGQGTGDPNYAVGCVEASSPLGFDNSGKYSDNPLISRAVPAAGKPEITHIGQPWVVEGLNGFEKWFGYFAQTTADNRTQRIDRMHFFDRKLFIDGPTDRWSPGYHPSPAKPQYLGLFYQADGAMPARDWNLIPGGNGTWEVLDYEARQNSQNCFSFNLVNRDTAAFYLFEANVKMTAAQDSEDKAGVVAYYENADSWMIVGLDRSLGYGADNWYCHVRDNGADTVYSGAYGGSLDYSVYHKIRVIKNGGSFDIRIDDMIPPGHTTITTSFTGAGRPGLYSNHAPAAFDGVIYTIGWDEYDNGITGWGASDIGTPPVGSWTVAADGFTQSLETGVNYIYKGDEMAEYEFSAQVAKAGSNNGKMGIVPVSIDSGNYLIAWIDLVADKLYITGYNGGVLIASQEVAVPNKTSYNIRAARFPDKTIIFVDGQEKLTVNEAFGPSQVALITENMAARYNGILAYRTEPKSLPGPWKNTDIGGVGFAGHADSDGDTFVLNGSGTDMWGAYDEGHFAYLDATGDYEFIARIVSLDITDYWARGGIMMRDSLSEGNHGVQLYMSPGSEAVILTRNGVNIAWVDNKSFPMWLKLKRTGSSFQASYSTDGSSYTTLGSCTASLAAEMKVGLFVSAKNNTRITSAVFDHVTQPLPPEPTCWIDTANLYWSSADGVAYNVEYTTNLLSAWQTLANGIEATPPENSLPLPDDDSGFFSVEGFWQ